jgi:hypothetical protein
MLLKVNKKNDNNKAKQVVERSKTTRLIKEKMMLSSMAMAILRPLTKVVKMLQETEEALQPMRLQMSAVGTPLDRTRSNRHPATVDRQKRLHQLLRVDKKGN